MYRKVGFVCKGIVCLILAVALLMFFTPIGAFCAIAFECILVKWDIDNPYVNTEYQDWKTVSVNHFASIRIPSGWEVQDEDGIIMIMDDETVWAQGAVFGINNERFRDDTELMKWLTDTEDIEISYDAQFGSIEMEGSDMGRLQISGDVFESYYYIMLENRTLQDNAPTLILILNHDLEQNKEYYEIAEAMVYSFAYPLNQQFPSS